MSKEGTKIMAQKYLRLAVTSLVISILFVTSPLRAQQMPWNAWVKQLREQAIDKGIRPAIFDRAFRNIKAPSRKVLRLDRNQPEKRLTYLSYRNSRADAYRIKIGRRALRKNYKLLRQVSAIYGVSPAYIVSFWGLESSYGHYKGNFPVIQSLATLAYDNRRGKFFRTQLFYALQILNDGHVRFKDFKGEWAGASGHPQFLPSSWYKFAVDHDGDGRKDIWNTYGDVFASIANYLKQNGWQSGQQVLTVVRTPKNIKHYAHGLKTKKSIADWKRQGVRLKGSLVGLDSGSSASLVRPYGGPTWLVFNNFRVIMRWNRSIYYAGTVNYLAQSIAKSKS